MKKYNVFKTLYNGELSSLVFTGTEQECDNFINHNGGSYQVVPVTQEEIDLYMDCAENSLGLGEELT